MSVPVDFIDFVPAEFIRRLTAVNPNQTMGVNYLLIDSGIEDITYFHYADGSKAVSHVGTGNYMVVYPGYDSIIQINHRGGGDSSYLVNTRLVAVPYYEPRRRNL